MSVDVGAVGVGHLRHLIDFPLSFPEEHHAVVTWNKRGGERLRRGDVNPERLLVW